MSSSLMTDWNCSFNTLAFEQSDVAGKPEVALIVGMPVLLYVRLLYMTKRI